MNYEKSEPFSGSPAKAIDFVAVLLASSGFRIEERSDTTLRAKGSWFLTSTTKNNMFGVSMLKLQATGGLLRAEATIDAAKRLLQLLGLILSIVFVATTTVFLFVPMRNHHGELLPTDQRLEILLLPYIPWLVLGPLVAWIFRSRARKTVDNLLHNAATMAFQ